MWKSSIKNYLDNPQTHALVKIEFRIGDHMHGVENCFKLREVRKFDKPKPSTRIVDFKTMETVPNETTRIHLKTEQSRRVHGDWINLDGKREAFYEGDIIFGPFPTDEVCLYITPLVKNSINQLFTCYLGEPK